MVANPSRNRAGSHTARFCGSIGGSPFLRSKLFRAPGGGDLGRFVPVSTGGGKALFIGTYLPGDGIHEGVKQHLLHQIRGGPPIPEERLLGMTIGAAIDAQDNLWVVHRSSATLHNNEKGAELNPPTSACCRSM